MNRYYSDSDDGYPNHRRKSSSARISGWQSPLLNLTNNFDLSHSSSTKRIVVDSPFGLDKCDYSIDRSHPGRLIVTARRTQTSSSSGKNRVVTQSFYIPEDADVDHLESHVERSTNRLIIDIPRHQRSSHRSSRYSYGNSSGFSRSFPRSPDVERMLTSPMGGPHLVRDGKNFGKRNTIAGRKLEYRIDCHGYAADELEVFVRGRDLLVQGKTRASFLSDPKQRRVSKKFSRKISLPSTVDLNGIISHLENGELRIEAPIKPGIYHSDEEIIVPGPPPSSTSGRATSVLINNLERRTRSPNSQFGQSSSSNSHHYSRRNHYGTGRQRDYDRSKNRRFKSADAIRSPLLVSPREIDEDNENDDMQDRDMQRQHVSTYRQRQFVHTKPKESQFSTSRSIYSPTKNLISSSTKSRTVNESFTSDEENDMRF